MKTFVCKTILVAACACCMTAVSAQKLEESIKYRRSSIYTILVNHTEQKFATEIRNSFMMMPVPDKYEDHNLSVRCLDIETKLDGAKSEKENPLITEFLNNNYVASRLVAKWYNRDMFTGEGNTNLIVERGAIGMTEEEKAIYSRTTRRIDGNYDKVGEELIGNTFVLVNDIRYVDKENTGKGWGMGLRLFGSILGAATGNRDLTNMGNSLGNMMETLKGFSVRVNTFLYQLEWNEDIQHLAEATFDEGNPEAFEGIRSKFHLKYVGKVESKGSTTSFMGVNLDEPINMVNKACQRALDDNVADLQHQFIAFRTKSPLISNKPLRAYVGLKEGVSADSRFEVLEEVEDEKGRISYHRVGVIKPKPNMIWDNRYMAIEENAPNAELGFTTFERVSGKIVGEGLLIREMDR